MSLSIILPTKYQEEKQQSAQDRIAAMDIEELEQTVFHESFMLGKLSGFGLACDKEISRRRSAHRQKVERNSVFGKLWMPWTTEFEHTLDFNPEPFIIRRAVPGLISLADVPAVQPKHRLPDRIDVFTPRAEFGHPSDLKVKTSFDRARSVLLGGEIDWMNHDLITERKVATYSQMKADAVALELDWAKRIMTSTATSVVEETAMTQKSVSDYIADFTAAMQKVSARNMYHVPLNSPPSTNEQLHLRTISHSMGFTWNEPLSPSLGDIAITLNQRDRNASVMMTCDSLNTALGEDS